MRWRCLAAVLLAAAVLAGCGGGGGASKGATLTVYVSAPLQGESAGEGRALVTGAKRALADAGGRAGEFRLRAVYLDDARGRGWNVVRTAANARQAAENVSTIAYIGELDPAATRISLPITNQAEMAQIFPGGSGGQAVSSIPGGGNSQRYQPSGKDTFVPLSGPSGGSAAEHGAEAMKMLIEAIDRAGGDGADRGAVLDQLLAE